MRIDDESQRPVGSDLVSHFPRALRSRRVAIVVYTLLVFGIGIAVQRAGLIGGVLEPIRRLTTLPARLDAMKVEPDRITIDIKHKHLMKIAHKREEALARRLLVTSPDDLVPATIRTGDRTIPVRLRLKGDLRDHWEGDKWSFRIRTRGENTLWGMKQFSIQQPATRNYIYEWLYHENLRREGLPALRYRFLEVIQNGDRKGIYALEEHFEKRLIENAALREGPVIRFGEDASWIETRDQGFLGFDRQNAMSGGGSYLASDVDGFRTNEWLEDPFKRAQYLEAVHLLEGFRRGHVSVHDTFDVPKLATFLAVSDLHEAGHATAWRNMRFYYNPVTSRLEPIGFDATDRRRPDMRSIVAMRPWVQKQADFYDLPFYRQVFADADVYRAYVSELERVSAPEYLDALLTDLGPEIERNVAVLKHDYPRFRFARQPLVDNARYLRAVLSPPKGLLAHIASTEGRTIELEIGNVQIFPVEVLELGIQGGERLPLEEIAVLPGRPIDSLVDYRRVRAEMPAGTAAIDPASQAAGLPPLVVAYRIAGTHRVRTEPVVPWPTFPDTWEPNLSRRAPNVTAFDFLEVDEAAREIRVRPGSWRVEQDLVVPAGYRLRAGGGTELELRGPASILSRSPLELVGEAELPIRIHGDGALMVVQAGERSRLEHVVFDGMTEPAAQGMNVTGAVTFYESPVDFTGCRFLDARAEDALNVVRSPFTLRQSLFENAASDAFDADFSDGTIEDTTFVTPANDGVDVSGSVVSLRGVTVRGSGDKAVSAGENSRMSLRQIVVEDSKVGVASKDLSSVRAYGLTIASTEIGVAAYQKKSEFGPASVSVERVEMTGVDDPYWIEERSSAVVEGQEREGDRTDPRPVFYPEG
jgi:hypothetical protein